MRGQRAPLVFVTVGTDHHPFDRLVGWVDEWFAALAPGTARCVMQTGTSRPPRHSEWHDYLGYAEMGGHLRRAAAVVCHGGPATIMDARGAGRRPIVVPRRRSLGEHVDDHQRRFAHRMRPTGHIALAEDPRALGRLLDEVVAEPGSQLLATHGRTGEDAVSRFAELVSRLVVAG
ncbi:MAG: glycosyl transferase family 28 [Actinomycetota bacterium]|nr:glycosyl transferase family 28 [Actinomycetota bacterium]